MPTDSARQTIDRFCGWLVQPRMRRHVPLLVLLPIIACHRSPPPPSDPPKAPEAPAPTALVQKLAADATQGGVLVATALDARRLLLVSDEDDGKVLLMDGADGSTVAAAKVEGRPAQVMVLPDGSVAVALRDRAEVATFVLEKSTETQALSFRKGEPLETAVEPIALARKGSELLVATGWSHTLERFDLETRTKRASVDLPKEPRAVVARADGTVFVSHASAGVLTRVLGSHVLPMKLDDGPTNVRQGFALAALGNDVIAPDVSVNPEDMNDPSMEEPVGGYGGGMRCNNTWRPGWTLDEAQFPRRAGNKDPWAGKTADAKDGNLRRGVGADFLHNDPKRVIPAVGFDTCVRMMSNTFTLHRVQAQTPTVTHMGTTCLLPRAVAIHAGRREAYLACLGTNRVHTIALGSEGDAKPPRITRDWKLPSGPMGLAVDGDALYVWSQFAHALTRISLADEPKPEPAKAVAKAAPSKADAPATNVLATFALPRETARTADVDLGRELFHASGDTRISEDGRACASCHPDGRTDGISWSTPSGKRKPLFLAGRVGDGPFGWKGEHKTLGEHITHTIVANLHGSGLTAAATKSLEAYLKVMPGPPATKDNLSGPVIRGKQLFASAEVGCTGCHRGQTFTDEERHDVGTGGEFRTPSLRSIAGAGPYNHGGKYASLGDFLKSTDGKMGHTAQLPPEDFNALVLYLSSL